MYTATRTFDKLTKQVVWVVKFDSKDTGMWIQRDDQGFYVWGTMSRFIGLGLAFEFAQELLENKKAGK